MTLDAVKPDPEGVFLLQGIPKGTQPSSRLIDLYKSGEKNFSRLAAPIGLMMEITVDEFTGLYKGEGLNEPDTPLPYIFPRARRLSLFAFTLGPAVSREIESLHRQKNIALSYMLDSIASFSAEKAAKVAERIYFEKLYSLGEAENSTRVLLYSPGYCGWHVSGQRKLFDLLKPENIGISLNERFLMIPLKSVSGVLVAGDPTIHQFKNSFPFCASCRASSCRATK